VNVVITAILDDPDNETVNGITWQWYRGSSPITGADNGENTNTSTYTPVAGNIGSRLRARGAGALMSSYTPTTGDVGSVLRATAMYDDGEDEDKTAQEDSANSVRRAPDTNTDPVFPDQDLNAPNVQTAQTREVAENTPAGRNLGPRVAATDPGDVLTYSLDTGNDAASFDINRATGQLTTKAALDYEDADIRESTVTVTATDPFGATVTSVVTITVTDVNEDPTLMGAASIDHEEGTTVLDVDATNQTADAAEYTAADVDDADDVADLRWTLRGADESKFEITDTGATRVLSFMDAPDFESPTDSGRNNVYEVTIRVTDSEGNTADQAVTVKVTNMEEAGTVTLSTLQPRVDFPVTATLADADNITAGSVSWQWYRGNVQTTNLPEECAETTANNCAIKDAASDTYTPVADDIGDTLTAVASYTDGSPNEGDAKDVVAAPAANQVLADTRNKAPVFPDQDTEMEGRQTAQERMIAENTAAAEVIGAPVAATDEDMSLTYSLGGPDAASFDIVRTSGQLQTKAELDKETKDTYTVTVTAADSLSESSTITVTIKVTNVDEMPDLEGEAPEEYAENGTGAVATFTAVDPEGESIVWSLATGGDMEDFTIKDGVLRFMNSPDFEDPKGGGANGTDNTYVVTVQASDGGDDTTATEELTIEVTNVEEPGTVTLSTLQPQVGVAITATLTDPDNATATTVTWQWYRGNSEIVGATDGAGALMSSYTPTTGDVGSVLRATAMYDDGEDEDKTAQEDSAHAVRQAPESNIPPTFPDQDLEAQNVQTAQTRTVAENTRLRARI
jgi:serralysin